MSTLQEILKCEFENTDIRHGTPVRDAPEESLPGASLCKEEVLKDKVCKRYTLLCNAYTVISVETGKEASLQRTHY